MLSLLCGTACRGARFAITKFRSLHTCPAEDLSRFHSKKNLLVCWLDLYLLWKESYFCWFFLAMERITIGKSLNLMVNAVTSWLWARRMTVVHLKAQCHSRAFLLNVLVSLDPNRTATGPLNTLHYVIIQTFSPPSNINDLIPALCWEKLPQAA